MTHTTRSLVCSMLLAALSLTSAQAQSVYEPFNYTAGDSLPGKVVGGNTWGTQNTGTAVSIAGGNLSVSGLAASAGNSAVIPGGNFQEAVLPFTGTAINSGTIYFSFAFQLSSQPTATTYSFGLNNSTNFAATIWLQASGAGYQVGLANRSNSTPSYNSTVFSLGQTVFLVGSYQFNGGASNDVSSLWINPSSATFESGSAPSATITATGGTDIASINSFLIRGATGSPAGLMDELRIGSSWADVTPAAIPEPSTYAAIFGALALGAVVYVRRRKASAV